MTDTKPRRPTTVDTRAQAGRRSLGRREVVMGLGASVALLPLVGCEDDDDTVGASSDAGTSQDSGASQDSGSAATTQDSGTSTADASSGDTGGSSDSGSGDASTGTADQDSGTSYADAASDPTSDADTSSDTCVEIPDETAGPYPDTMDMINNADFERADVREDRTGTDLTLRFTVLDQADGCSPLVGHKLMIWHCDKDGIYSEYANNTNAGSTTSTYLRGWQVTDSNGQVEFQTIYPGWYIPRATHVHIQLYDTDGSTLLKTTQIGFEDSLNAEVYDQTDLYTKGQNGTTNDSDQVWGLSGGTGTDGGGHDYQIATVSGTVDSGLTATIDIPV